MAVTIHNNVVRLDAPGDEVAQPLRLGSIRWDGGAAVAAGDNAVLVQSSTGDITREVWRTTASGVNYVESDSNGGRGYVLPNGLRVDSLSAGVIYAYII